MGGHHGHDHSHAVVTEGNAKINDCLGAYHDILNC